MWLFSINYTINDVAVLQRKPFVPKRPGDLLFRFELLGEPLDLANDCQIYGRQFPAIEHFHQALSISVLW